MEDEIEDIARQFVDANGDAAWENFGRRPGADDLDREHVFLNGMLYGFGNALRSFQNADTMSERPDRLQSGMTGEDIRCVKKALRSLTHEELLDHALATALAVHTYCVHYGSNGMLKTQMPLSSKEEADRLKEITLKVQQETIRIRDQRARRN